MVKKAIICALLLVGITPASAERMLTVDELRQLAGDADRTHREKRARIQGGDLSQLLPEQKNETVQQEIPRVREKASKPVQQNTQKDAPVEKQAPRVTKYSQRQEIDSSSMPANSIHKASQNAADSKTKTAPAVVKSNPFEYVPPPRMVSTDSTVFTDAVTVDDMEYGIRIGTWIDVAMLRNISSGEPGVVAFQVKQTVQGRYRMLEAGTELFAEKVFNGATQRLEMMVTRGVTLSGEEFEVRGQVYDTQKISGLDGIVKKKELVKGSVQSGLLAATRTAIGAVANDSPVGAGASTAADVILREGEGAVSDQLQDEYVIYVSSQDAKLFITQAF